MLRVLATFKPVLQQIRLFQAAKNLLQKVESSSTFWNKIWACCAFYLPKANLFCSKWRNSCIWRDSRVILSNQKSVLTQIAASFGCCKTSLNLGGKTSLFNTFCSSWHIFVARFTVDLETSASYTGLKGAVSHRFLLPEISNTYPGTLGNILLLG